MSSQMRLVSSLDAVLAHQVKSLLCASKAAVSNELRFLIKKFRLSRAICRNKTAVLQKLVVLDKLPINGIG